MKKGLSFAEILEAADKLSLEEQETIIDILYRRIIEHRRKELVREVQEAQREFKEGYCHPSTPEQIMKAFFALKDC